MGRRARTNCSPVDSVLEKYHSDIGNRLSGVFMPPPNTEGGQPGLCEDFSMLTLDLRRANSVRNKARVEQHTTPSALKNSLFADTTHAVPPPNDKVSHLELCRTSTKQESEHSSAFPSATHHHHHPSDALVEQECASKDKTRLVDKLTRALFQKKHVCARCKRKSRTCVLNKTFSATEKRYTCGRCRENSSALKNFFDGQSGDKQDVSSFSSLSSSSSPASKRDVPQSRLANDSGYETVTSCSTVASSYSAFNTPHSKNNSSKENASRLAASQQMSTDGVESHCQKPVSAATDHAQACTCGTDEASPVSHNQLHAAQHFDHKLPGLHEYDGYLPDFIEFRGWNRHMIRPCSQGDASTSALADSEDAADFGPDIICVRRPTSLDSSPRPARKACHTCGTTTVPCFRLPWEGGWLCEDCMDGIY